MCDYNFESEVFPANFDFTGPLELLPFSFGSLGSLPYFTSFPSLGSFAPLASLVSFGSLVSLLSTF